LHFGKTEIFLYEGLDRWNQLDPARVLTPLCVVSRIRAGERIGDRRQTVNVELIGESYGFRPRLLNVR
jgi:hypothetical protein